MHPLYARISIVHQSPRFVVIDKPPGLLSVPGKGESNQFCAADWVRRTFPDATGPITVHRLDMETSGLLLLALDADTQRHLSMQFEARAVEKTYIALVAGIVTPDSGTIDVPLRMDPDRRPIQVIDRTLGKTAVTAYKTLAVEKHDGQPCTRLELIPHTGRTHQLRVHCMSIGHPILGDSLYGGTDLPTQPRLCLHAARLVFTDPDTDERITCTTPPGF